MTNEFDLAAQEMALRKQQEAQAGAAIGLSHGVNPNDAAEALSLSKKTGTPADITLRNIAEVRQQVSEDVYLGAIKDSPSLRKLVTDPTMAAAMRDDAPNLAAAETETRKLKTRLGRNPVQNTKKGWAGIDVQGEEVALAVENAIRGPLTWAMRATGVVDKNSEYTGSAARDRLEKAIKRYNDLPSEDRFGIAGQLYEDRAARGDTIGGVWNWAKYMAQNSDAFVNIVLQYGLEGAPGSIAAGGAVGTLVKGTMSTGAARATATAAANAGGTFAGGMSGETAGKFQETGDLDASLEYGAKKATVDALVNAPFAFFGAKIGGLGGEASALTLGQRAARQTGEAAVQGLGGAAGAGSAAAAVGEDFNLADALTEGLADFATSPVSIGIGEYTTAMDRAERQELQRRVDEAKKMEGKFNTLLKAYSAAGTSETLPETFAQLIQEAAVDSDSATDVFINANKLAEIVGEQRLFDLREMIPELNAQLDEARATNGDISLPIGIFATHFAKTGLEKQLAENMKVDADGLSSEEARTVLEDFKREASTLTANRPDAAAWQAEVDTIYKETFDGLNNLKRFTPDVNKAYAALIRDFYSTTAARANTTPAKLAERFKLQLSTQSVDPNQAKTLSAGGNQPVLMNVGMSASKNIEGSADLTEQQIIDAITAEGGKVRGWSKQKSDSEDTVVAELEEPLTKEQLHRISENLKQEGVVQRNADRTGVLAGPMAANWGDYSPDYFVMPDGRRAAAHDAEGLGQSATLRRGTETLKKYGLTPGKRYTTRQVAAALEARQRAKYGKIDATDRSPEALKKISKWMVEEVEFEMQNPEKSGIGWYSEKFQRALDIMADEFPELRTDKSARNMMTALIAITSDGQKVVPNFLQAMHIYGNWKSTGKFSTERGTQRIASVEKNLQVIQRLHDTMGVDVMHDYLMQEKSISELKKIAEENGGELKSDYQVHISMPMAAVEFGPKLGAFYANLMGAHGYLTMDRWWSRTFNRYRGTLLDAPTRKGLDRFKALLGNPTMSDDEAIAATVAPHDAYASRKFKNGTEIEKAANTIYKAAFEALEDAPFNAKDRTFMLDAVNAAQKSLARKGHKISVADIQAILWYYEKRLYGELGARQSADVSYEDAAKRVVEARKSGLDVQLESEELGADEGEAEGELPIGEEDYAEDASLGQEAFRGDFKSRVVFLREGKTADSGGKGRKVFGWGLYLTADRRVAEGYAKPLGEEGGVHSFEIPENYELLDLDSGLRSQPDRVKNLLRVVANELLDEELGQRIRDAISGKGKDFIAREMYDLIAENEFGGNQEQTSKFLAQAGIPGGRFMHSPDIKAGIAPAENFVLYDASKAIRREGSNSLGQEDAPVFYSALVRELEKVKEDRTKASRWISVLTGKLQGVKREEVEVSGVLDWLEGLGNETVSREDVLEFVRQNGVQIEEVMRGKDPVRDPGMFVSETENLIVEIASQYDLQAVTSESGIRFEDEDDVEVPFEDLPEQIQQLMGRYKLAKRVVEEGADEGAQKENLAGPAKYAKYQLPGGENYRELLLTLPQRDPNENWALEQEKKYGRNIMKWPDDVLEEYDRRRGAEYRYQVLGAFPRSNVATEEDAQAYIDQMTANINGMPDSAGKTSLLEQLERYPFKIHKYRKESPRKEKDKFRSGHWDETNVLVHIRFNERTGTNGERVLHIEEVQSDWHQAGRKHGYKKPRTPKIQAEIDSLRAQAKAKFDEMKQHVDDADETVFKRLQEERDQINDRRFALEKSVDTGVVDAPFKNTPEWAGLAMKRMIRYAVDNGFDAVTWTGGVDQADRYDLSKEVDRIEYDSKGRLIAYRDGRSVINKQVDESKLEDAIGKELAERLLNSEADDGVRAISGDDLKVGGLGMIKFYDEILPEKTNSIIKKMGSKVERFDLDTGESGARYVMDAMDVNLPGDAEQEVIIRHATTLNGVATFNNMDDAEAWLDENDGDLKVQGFRVTDKMREQVAQGQALFQKKTDRRGEFHPPTLTISLLEKADLSTFLHETGHFFFEMQAILAAEGASPEIAADIDALLKFVGYTGTVQQWLREPIGRRREGHEKVAESFEEYLATGKAPTVELQPLFQTFRRWLISVYKSIEQMLRINKRAALNDEVRQVFDRMIATEEAIARSAEIRGLLPQFASAEEAGMTQEEFAQYQKDVAATSGDAADKLQARLIRDMRWLSSTRSKILRNLTEDAKAKRKAIHDEVAAEIGRMQVYRVMEFLKRGTLLDENGVEVQSTLSLGSTKLNLAALKVMYPNGEVDPKALGFGKYGMVSADGMSPDIVAGQFGYGSADEMVRAILAAEPKAELIAGLVDERMIERHGDISTQEGLQRAADDALANEAHSRMVATELRGLDARVGKVNYLKKAAKYAAMGILERKPLRLIRPDLAASAAARARRDSKRLLGEGKRDEAVAAKRNEMLHLELQIQGLAVKREMDKFFRDAAKVFKGKTADVAKRRDMDLVNAARAILAAYGVGPKGAGKAAAQYMQMLDNYSGSRAADIKSMRTGLPPVPAGGFADLSLADARTVRDIALGIFEMAKDEKEVTIDGQRVALDEVATEIVDAVIARDGEIGPLPGYTSTTSRNDEIRDGLQSVRSTLRRVESWADAMGPVFKTYIWQPVAEAVTVMRGKRNALVEKYLELLKTIEPTLTYTPIAAPELYGFVFKGGKSQVLHAILHSGNQSNLRKLLVGRGWGKVDAKGNLDTSKWNEFVARLIEEGTLTKADFDFAQGVWDLLETVKADAQKAHHDMYGYYFNEITADPIDTPFGKYRGGYVPALADPLASKDIAQKREAEDLLHGGNSFMFPSTGKGFTNSRVEFNRPLELDLRVIGQHLDKVARFAYLEPAIRDVGKIINNPRVQRALNGMDGTLISRMLNPWLQRTAQQRVGSPGRDPRFDKFTNALRNRSGMVIMFANIVNTLQQITGFSLAALKVPVGALTRSNLRMMHDRSAMLEFAANKSPWLADRMSSKSFEMQAAVDKILTNQGTFSSALEFLKQNAYFMQQAVQNYMDCVIWTAAYDSAVARGASDKQAVRAADEAVRTTQGSFAPEDIAAFESNIAFVRLFTQFYGYFNMQANLLGTETSKALREMGYAAATPRLLFIYFAGFAIPAFVAALIAEGRPDDEDDEDKDGMLDEYLAMFFGSQARTLAAMTPVAGQLAQVTANMMDDKVYNDRLSISPALSMVESASRSVATLLQRKYFDERMTKKEVRDALTLIGLATGAPTGPIARSAGYAIDVSEGRKQPEDAIDQIIGYATGK